VRFAAVKTNGSGLKHSERSEGITKDQRVSEFHRTRSLKCQNIATEIENIFPSDVGVEIVGNQEFCSYPYYDFSV